MGLELMTLDQELLAPPAEPARHPNLSFFVISPVFFLCIKIYSG